MVFLTFNLVITIIIIVLIMFTYVYNMGTLITKDNVMESSFDLIQPMVQLFGIQISMFEK